MSIQPVSLIDLSVNSVVRREDGFVALRCYFDGGNQADAKQYKTMTLCAITGAKAQWENFEKRWWKLLKKHDAPWIHTTDMLTLNDPFTVAKGWSLPKVDRVLSDCVKTIEDCKAKPEKNWSHGIMPITITVVLKDFEKAALKIPNLRTPELHTAMHCLQMCGYWADHIGVNRLQLTFDQNERFYGHVSDRWKSKRARKEEYIWDHIIAIGEADSRAVPGLQVADLIAWCVGKKHDHGITHEWQRHLLRFHKESEFLDFKKLKAPDAEVLESLDRWKIPPRKPFR